jgi:hypothetical protein
MTDGRKREFFDNADQASETSTHHAQNLERDFGMRQT